MRVTLLGTGCPQVSPHRAGAATLYEAGERAVLVDCGSGVTQALVAAGTSGAEIDALVVTHLHSDHLVDFYQLVVSAWHQGRDRAWVVHCPDPVAAVIHATMAAWAEERAQRIAWEGRKGTEGLEVETRRLDPDRPLAVGPFEIAPVAVDHFPVVPAYGLVFRADSFTAVHSGDTAVSEALIAAGAGADLLVHEVFLHAEMAARPRNSDLGTVARYHTLSSEVGGVAARMGARALALTHFVPVVFDRHALLAEVARDYAGPIFVGEDGMAFDLAARTVDWGPVAARVLP